MTDKLPVIEILDLYKSYDQLCGVGVLPEHARCIGMPRRSRPGRRVPRAS